MIFLNKTLFFIISIGIFTILMTKGTNCEVVSNPYRAAVVEYHPEHYPEDAPPEIMLMDNVKRYAKIIAESKENLDIVVFPESTITTAAVLRTRLAMLNYSTTVPDPSDAVDVCDSENRFPQFFKYLACTAKEANIYLVVNLIEQTLCLEKSHYGEVCHCSKDLWDFYNTDVVFDRRGRVIARYRKYHLFGEHWMNRTVIPDISIFETDFGVKFGLFTCFDILFKQPPIDLVKLHGIKSVIYPSMWYSELPFLTALQTQMQWSYEFDVVFLSAGANNCIKGSGGSGIFEGKSGAAILDYPKNGQFRMYTAVIPGMKDNDLNSVNDEDNIDDLARQMDNFYLMKENLSEYTMQHLDTEDQYENTVLCSNHNEGQFCCHFYVEMEINEVKSNSKQYYYYMVIFNGSRSFKGIAHAGLEVCGIVACTNKMSESCGQRFPNYDEVTWPVTFKAISIKGNFTFGDNNIQYPNSLLSSIRPLPVDSFEWNSRIYDQNTTIERTFNLVKPQNRLFTFAIYGRNFNNDTF